MKKQYIIPTTLITKVHSTTMIALSMEINSETTTDTQYVKGDRGGRGGRSDYNVWNDDWSK